MNKKRILRMIFVVACAFTLVVTDSLAQQSQTQIKPYNIPAQVKVLPVAFVPTDEATPALTAQETFLKHLLWAQRRYRELLDGDTFQVAGEEMVMVRGQHPLDYYRNQPENGAPNIVAELLEHFKVSRFENPYVFCILVANSRDSFPMGGGRPINGGLNSGGGMMFISSFELHRNKHFQTTLQHELGHSFGLPHVDVYGYDMKANASLMSYNPTHWCNGFQPCSTPGVLIPEDRRALALNNRAFSATTFDQLRHIPEGYKLSPHIVPLGAMKLPGCPDFYPEVTTDAGEAVRSSVSNIVSGRIKPSAGPGITYDSRNMWHSEKQLNNSATLTIAFPFNVHLTGIAIHSQHSGIDHEVTAMRLEALDADRPRLVAAQPISDVDSLVTFPRTQSQRWRLTLATGKSGMLVIRGLRFLDGNDEVVPHMIPYGTDE